ncbi:MAG TPA: endolytic transglycosylase MltG [Rectinemataceae bacterium]|nr:endolytic transglycosylase MltG [Rectinemataceae bacterium]
MQARALLFIRVLIVILALAFAVAGAGIGYVLHESRPVLSVPTAGSLFAIEKGDNAQSIGKRLEQGGLIRSAAVFHALIRLEDPSAVFKTGTYRIGTGMGTQAIIQLLLSGKQALIRVTVPEGFTISQTAALLDRLGVAAAAEFRAACHDPALLTDLHLPPTGAEGYLFPDTYFFPASYGGAEAVRAMVAAFRQRLSTIPEAAELSSAELRDRIILASIVEREYKQPDEAPLIASVFFNRLRIKMALQSCATVVYVLTEREGKPHPEVIYDRDLAIEDPYNSYLYRGLPPGPICSPGMTSLHAVFYPATTHYLYFRLIDPAAGRHHFSTTLEEHIDAKNLFIKQVGS